jgi:hypothetical protein
MDIIEVINSLCFDRVLFNESLKMQSVVEGCRIRWLSISPGSFGSSDAAPSLWSTDILSVFRILASIGRMNGLP